MASSAQRDRFRRQLLRQAVEENLDTLAGQPLGSSRRQREQRHQRLRRLVLAAGSVLAASLVGAAAWLTVTPDQPAASPVVVQPLLRAAVAGSPAPPSAERVARRLAVGSPDALLGRAIPLAVRRVVLDPGHGGADGGTSLRFGVSEKDLTKDIANRLQALLEGSGCEAVLTRTGDETVSLKKRAELANGARADLFVSIHVNWLPDSAARGVETYYAGPTDDPFLTRLAATENRRSGFSIADTRRLLDGVYADLRQDQSQHLAEAIQGSLHDTLRQSNPRIVSRGVMTAPFVVLIATDMPAVLAEVACLSNDEEARLLTLPSYRQRIAEALHHGILAYARTVGHEPSQKGT